MDSVRALDWAALDWVPLDWVGANPVVAAVLLILLALVVLVFAAIFNPFGRGWGRGRSRNRSRDGVHDGGAVVRRHDSGSRAQQTDERSPAAIEAESIDADALAGRLLSKPAPGAAPEVDPVSLTAAQGELAKAVEALKTRIGRDREPDRALTALRHLGGRRLTAAEAIFGEILAEKQRESFDGRLEAAAAARHLGALAVLHDTAAALTAYEAAVDLDSQNAGALASLAEIYGALGRPEDAERRLNQLLQIEDWSHEDGFLRAVAFSNLGGIAEMHGDLDRAIDLHQQSLKLNRETERLGAAALDLLNLGILHHDKGDYDLAEEMLGQSRALGEQFDDEVVVALTSGNLGLVHKARGEDEAAEEALNRMLELVRKHGDQERQGFCLFHLAGLAVQRGEREHAAQLYQQSLTLAEAVGNTEAMASTRAGLGDLAEENGNLEAARTQWAAARDLYRQAGVDAQVAALDDMLAKTDRPPVRGA